MITKHDVKIVCILFLYAAIAYVQSLVGDNGFRSAMPPLYLSHLTAFGQALLAVKAATEVLSRLKNRPSDNSADDSSTENMNVTAEQVTVSKT